MKLFLELEQVKKHGIGIILGAVTFDGYRRQYINDRRSNILETIRKEREASAEGMKAEYDQIIEEKFKDVKIKAAIGRDQEAADEHKRAVDRYTAEGSDYNNNEQIKSHKKLEEIYDEISKLDISDYFKSAYDNYVEFLDSLSPDKIVCLFNIITYGLIMSSFFSVLSIMLSENIINRISFLEKYPRILKLLKLRTIINKKVAKVTLFMHFIVIIWGLVLNIYMFFL